MRVNAAHSLVALLLPVFLLFSASTEEALQLFLAYTLLFYFPGYLFVSGLMPELPPVARAICSIFIGAAIMPQILYYLSLFSSPVNYYFLLFAGIASAALALAKDSRENAG